MKEAFLTLTQRCRSSLLLYLSMVLLYSQAFHPSTFHHTHSLDSSSIKATMASSSIPQKAVMPPADLTPAVDKFVRFPEGLFGSSERSANNKGITTPINPNSRISAKGPAPEGPDPFAFVASDLQSLSDVVKDLVVSENPVLTMAASHFFQQRQGKRFRPTIVSLISRALNPTADGLPDPTIYGKQLQLGQITEMIHVASLIHDDVLDDADMRRGGAAVHTMYTNKVAVLAGDYLLARASVLLAKLQHFQVVEVMAGALDALVQGEIMQARSKKEELLDINYYLRKSYFKTASLICSSCKSASLLSGYDELHAYTKAAEAYGYHLGMAYQIVDDILDFTGASATLGKPAQADMELGLTTAPILFAYQNGLKELKPLIERRFKEKGDIQQAVALAAKTNCVEQSYILAEFHANCAIEALDQLPDSKAKQALIKILHVAISRQS